MSEYDRERQRRHRLLEEIRPKVQAPAWADPAELGFEALQQLTPIVHFLRTKSSPLVGNAERVQELIRQLAYGPKEEDGGD